MSPSGDRSGRPFRLVHVAASDMTLELLLGPQLRAFAAAGYEVFGLSAPGPYAADLTARGITHVPLPDATRALTPLRDARALAGMARWFRRVRPDIVHTHNPKQGVLGRLAASATRVPVVVNTVHGLYAQPGDRWARRAAVYGAERLAARWSDAELVQNPEDLVTLARLGVPERKLHLLGNGVDLDRFDPAGVEAGRARAFREELGVEPGVVLVGAVGRLVWEKGYDVLFEAAARLRREGAPARVVVVGPLEPDKRDGLTPPDLERAARDAGVVYAGARRDMELVYAALDVYVLASRREGFPRSAMEAAAMGLPVVATDIRGCRQVVDDGTTGVLVPPGDATALATAVAGLAADPARRAAMGAAGRAKAAREFDQQRVIDMTLGVYDELLSRRTAGASR